MRVQEKIDFELLQHKIIDFPGYIKSFLEYKLNQQCSPSSMLEYIRDLEIFFMWLMTESLSAASKFSDISLNELERIEVHDLEQYKVFLLLERRITPRSIERKICSLKSVFNYLHDVAEDERNKPLLSRNITRKITSMRVSTPESSARMIQGKVLKDEYITNFLNYIEHTYSKEHKQNKQALYFFELNQKRDICIIAMQLLAGLRVSDTVDLNKEDVNLKKSQLIIQRDNQFVTVHFGEMLQNYILQYVNTRDSYTPSIDETAFFLSLPNGEKTGKRMTKRGIQEMIKKYGQAFGKFELTARQLRHSFGFEHSKKTDLITTKEHLSQNLESIEKYGYLAKLFGNG